MKAVDRADLPEGYKEDLEILEETIGRLNQRELYIFKMAKDFERLEGENDRESQVYNPETDEWGARDQ